VLATASPSADVVYTTSQCSQSAMTAAPPDSILLETSNVVTHDGEAPTDRERTDPAAVALELPVDVTSSVDGTSNLASDEDTPAGVSVEQSDQERRKRKRTKRGLPSSDQERRERAAASLELALWQERRRVVGKTVGKTGSVVPRPPLPPNNESQLAAPPDVMYISKARASGLWSSIWY